MLEAQNLRTLEVCVVNLDTKIGRAGEPLSLKELAHLENLYIVADYVCVTIPQKVAWKWAMFSSDEELSLSFNDVAAFARDVSYFHIKYQTLIMKDDWLPKMCAALGKRNIPFHSAGRNINQKQEKYVFSYRGPSYDKASTPGCFCFCGACLACVSRA
ncbi:hypothetical protein COCSUDRAFT_32862 [Coccomyxa subellipsoidea C-169]|uniref:Uncharacterized protein n=1 Tax=Coccomyxa subellipsoidea (strain C-169) TaxID=574566 RepID=I0Z2M0_COCSC|nr:hypothetical protein COCSUDRAFT_32862 [Coccomyxa subellipsoidea C-169]EIE24889.1 hypothetical protein COCSUDRAFT_32862 [Coccomyxa subellipsoidea C-169]|eukprot:XP_005649433.1 hypothetical protein COCSUDRAFT_32862 [Coccomyxa subellipsoidea C-169]